MYQVFADFADWRDGSPVAAVSSHPQRTQALVVDAGDGRHAILANLTEEPQRVVLAPLTGSRARVRVLDESTGALAIGDPSAFRATGELIEIRDGRLELTLQPFAVARIDLVPWG